MASNEKNINRRAFERIPANFMVHFYYGDSINFGTVTNMSENGMFVKTKMPLGDVNSEFEIIIPSQHSELKVPVTVRRLAKNDNFHEGCGVELQERSEAYLTYLQNVKSSASSTPPNR